MQYYTHWDHYEIRCWEICDQIFPSVKNHHCSWKPAQSHHHQHAWAQAHEVGICRSTSEPTWQLSDVSRKDRPKGRQGRGVVVMTAKLKRQEEKTVLGSCPCLFFPAKGATKPSETWCSPQCQAPLQVPHEMPVLSPWGGEMDIVVTKELSLFLTTIKHLD